MADFENQVDAWKAMESVNSFGSFKLSSFNCCNGATIAYFMYNKHQVIVSSKGWNWKNPELKTQGLTGKSQNHQNLHYEICKFVINRNSSLYVVWVIHTEQTIPIRLNPYLRKCNAEKFLICKLCQINALQQNSQMLAFSDRYCHIDIVIDLALGPRYSSILLFSKIKSVSIKIC